jgi:hypothetical protein
LATDLESPTQGLFLMGNSIQKPVKSVFYEKLRIDKWIYDSTWTR